MADIKDEISAAKVKRSGLWKSIRNYFREYCHCSSIHGFRYFGEKRTIFERVWWFFVFMACLAGCVVSIYLVYRKWDSSPVIVSFATRGTPIYSIPFPSVTVCPESKAEQGKFDYTSLLHKKLNSTPIGPQESKMFDYMSLICSYDERIKYGRNTSFSEDFFKVLDAVKPSFNIHNCYYMGRKRDCSKIFTKIITDEGICYTFNFLGRTEIFRESVVHFNDYHLVPTHSSNWSLEHGYPENAGVETYPERALLAGAKNAFSFDIATKKSDIDYACKDSLQGHRVLLHTAMRLPRPSQEYFRIPLDQAVVATIQPNMITTSNSVKVYNPKRRECYFPSERHLEYFKIYTSLNCQMECLTNFTKTLCGCVNFFMPRENGTRICGIRRTYCMRIAEKIMQNYDLSRKLENENDTKELYGKVGVGKTDCDCMPICTDLTYDAETSQTNFDWVRKFEAQKIAGNWSDELLHLSSLTLYFKSNNFITSQRNELYGPTDFLANFGGLIGLFTGFSVLSLMEMLYFLTVRLLCNSWLYGYWAGPES